MTSAEYVGTTLGQLHIDRVFMKDGKTRAECTCSCGAKTTKVLAMMKIGHVSSCGCLAKATRFLKEHGNTLVNTLGDVSQESTAYWGGFLFGDGSVDTGNKLQVCLTSNNGSPDYLRKLSGLLFSKDVINVYEHMTRCHLQATSDELCKNLTKFGIVPNKTKVSVFTIPEGAKPSHVIRGYFDADGWFSMTNQKGYVVCNWGLCSYLSESLEVVQYHLPVRATLSKKKNQELFELRIGNRADISEVTDWLRPDSRENCFPYKWDKICNFQNLYKLNCFPTAQHPSGNRFSSSMN